MKNLIFVIAMFIVSFVNSQVYTITTQEGNSVVMIGKNDYKVVMKKPHGGSITEVLNAKYVIDLNKKTSTFYDEGKLISVLPFDEVTVEDGVYTIKLTDYAPSNPNITYKTMMVLNTNKGFENLIWTYYNEQRNFTLVQILSKYQVNKTSK
jgi:hypothetical protein